MIIIIMYIKTMLWFSFRVLCDYSNSPIILCATGLIIFGFEKRSNPV